MATALEQPTDNVLLPAHNAVRVDQGNWSDGGRDRNIEMRATCLLDRHPHFRGRGQWIRCRCRNGRLVLSGRLPSFYLKQVAQESLRMLDGVDHIENRIFVASPRGEVRSQAGRNASGQPVRETRFSVPRPR